MGNRNSNSPEDRLKVIPLGGMGEIGKNMTVFCYRDEIVVVDCGLAFPEEEMLGIDIVIPDISYLIENRNKVKGILITHAHEDHVGGLPFVLKELKVPVYATGLAMGIIEEKLAEHELKLDGNSRVIKPRDTIKLGRYFEVEFFRVNHSVADAVGLAIKTPVGNIVYTGDFKLDQTPVDGQVTDYQRLSEYGDRGVLVLFSDSTNAERKGYTQSEKVVGETLSQIIGSAKGRVLVASFASNVHRIQQVITAAHKHRRKVAVVGRSMENTVKVAIRLGYLKVPQDTVVELEELSRLPMDRTVIMTTGSQGEPLSALTRMSVNDHRRVEIAPGDTVVIAATPVPGNEKLVHRTIDNLMRLGAEVVYETTAGVHVSGHASQEELKMMLNLTKPRFFVPIHGEYRHLINHAKLANFMGIPDERILVLENGTVAEFGPDFGQVTGKVTAGNVLVDGLGIGDVGNVVLKDRRQLSQDGIVIVVFGLSKTENLLMSGPDIVTRGFVYVRESEDLLEEARQKAAETIEGSLRKEGGADWAAIKSTVRDALGKFFYDKTKRRPMILPIVMEVDA